MLLSAVYYDHEDTENIVCNAITKRILFHFYLNTFASFALFACLRTRSNSTTPCLDIESMLLPESGKSKRYFRVAQSRQRQLGCYLMSPQLTATLRVLFPHERLVSLPVGMARHRAQAWPLRREIRRPVRVATLHRLLLQQGRSAASPLPLLGSILPDHPTQGRRLWLPVDLVRVS